MCIETQSLATALLPQFASEIGYDVQLMRLLSAYQLNPGTETYNAVKNYLSEKRSQQQQTLNTFNTGKRLDLNILDYENNLLWSTASLAKQDKIVLTYQASEYSQQATEGSAYQKFEDGSEYNLSWVSGGPLFTGGGAFKIGTLTAVATNTLTITTTGATVSTYDNSNNVSYNIYTFNENGTFDISGNVYDTTGSEIDFSLNYVIVGGGGTGGNNGNEAGGGGGGGGGQVRLNTILYTGKSQNYTVTIGSGGVGGSSNVPSNGSYSTLISDKITISVAGGLCGGNGGDGYGGSNGVYFGGTYVAGGWYAGGGGGAGGDGLNGGGSDASDCSSFDYNTYTSLGKYGNGGPGQNANSVFFPGTSQAFYGAGGGGGQNSSKSTCKGGYGENGGGNGGWQTSSELSEPVGGASNSGGGGGGAGLSNDAGNIGSGGSGICILSVQSSYLAT